MKVAYIVADPGIAVFGTKGASVHVQEIIRAWRHRGCTVEVFAYRRGGHVPDDLADLTVHEVPLTRVGPGAADRERALVSAAGQLAELVVAAGADLVYERYALFSTVLAEVRRRGAVGATVLEVNAPLLDEQRRHRVLVDEAGAAAALQAQTAGADVVACVSKPVADWVRDRCPMAGQVIVVPNGVNVQRMAPVEPGPTALVVFVGTLKPWHGVDQLIEAAAAARLPWRLRVVGDGPERAALERLADDLGVLVEFTGALPPAGIPAAMAGAWVAAAPYPAGEDYFSPLKIFEYGAVGLPVVASRIGQIPDVVEDGVTGLLVPPSDPGALAQAIDELVSNPEAARAMGRCARQLMIQRHTWDQVLAETLAPLSLAVL